MQRCHALPQQLSLFIGTRRELGAVRLPDEKRAHRRISHKRSSGYDERDFQIFLRKTRRRHVLVDGGLRGRPPAAPLTRAARRKARSP